MEKTNRKRQIKAAAAGVRSTIPEDFQLSAPDAYEIAGELQGVNGILDVIELAFEFGYSQCIAAQRRSAGDDMRSLRGDRTVEETAAAIGISKAALLAYERGERTPNDTKKKTIADYYGVAVTGLF